MFNAEEDDWMPTEEDSKVNDNQVDGDLNEDEPVEEGSNPFGADEADTNDGQDDATLPVEAPGGEPDVRERSVTIDKGASTTPSQGTISVSVGNAEKHGDGTMAYISYGVKVTSKRANIADADVRRRYSDFAWLQKQLELENPMRIIPQIPGKLRHKQLSRFDDEFIERRRFLLEYFLVRVASHDALSQSKCFIDFIQQAKAEFDVTKKSAEKKSMLQAAGNLVNTLRLKNQDEQFQQVRVSVGDLMTQLVTLEKSVEQARQHMMDVATEMNETAPVLTEIGRIEPAFEKAMVTLDKSVATVVQEAVDKAEDETTRVVEVVAEFHKLCESVLSLLTRRDLTEHAYDKASDEVNKKQTEIENVESNGAKGLGRMFSKKDPEVLKQEKLEGLNNELTKLKGILEDQEASLKNWNKTVKEELHQFELIKVRDLKKIMTAYTKINLNFHSRSKTAFEKALPVVSAISPL